MGLVRFGILWGFLGIGFYHIYLTQFQMSSKMTWMYEKTEYFHIPMENEASKYKLYLYGEGTYFESLAKRLDLNFFYPFDNFVPAY